MPVAVITYHHAMGRWEPDARGRLAKAAMTLYAERGFEQTTVAEIAARAGLTERTFFRHYRDKREVLFGGGADLEAVLVGAIAEAPAGTPPLPAAGAGLAAVAARLHELRGHAFARRRSEIIAANA